MPGAQDAEIAKLVQALNDDTFRSDFATDADRALRGKNIDQSKIQDLVDALKDTSKSELDYLKSVRDVLTTHGHSDRVKAQLV
jgi:hypothetical protein